MGNQTGYTSLMECRLCLPLQAKPALQPYSYTHQHRNLRHRFADLRGGFGQVFQFLSQTFKPTASIFNNRQPALFRLRRRLG